MAGRKPRLTPELQKRILQYLEVGNYFSTACELSGVSEGVGREWLSRGLGTHARPQTPLYASFAEAVKEAEAKAEFVSLGRIRKAAKGGELVKRTTTTKTKTLKDGTVIEETETQEEWSEPIWQADAWYLERKFAQRWGRTDKVRAELSGPDGGPIPTQQERPDLTKLTDEELAQYEAIAAKLARPEGNQDGEG